jgi:hypothetical protein
LVQRGRLGHARTLGAFLARTRWPSTGVRVAAADALGAADHSYCLGPDCVFDCEPDCEPDWDPDGEVFAGEVAAAAVEPGEAAEPESDSFFADWPSLAPSLLAALEEPLDFDPEDDPDSARESVR